MAEIEVRDVWLRATPKRLMSKPVDRRRLPHRLVEARGGRFQLVIVEPAHFD